MVITNKRIRKAVDGVKDNEVKAVLEAALSGDDLYLCDLRFYLNHKAAFKKLLPTYFNEVLPFGCDSFLCDYKNSDYYRYKIYRTKFLGYLAIEVGVVDSDDFTTVKNFAEADVKPGGFDWNAPPSTIFARGLEKGKFTAKALLAFLDKEPEYIKYFMSLIASFDNDDFRAAVNSYIQTAKLEDSLRFHVIKGMASASNAAALLKFTEDVEKYDYYRLRVMKDVATSLGDYYAPLPPKELIAVLRDAANGNVQKYLASDFRHTVQFIKAFRRVHEHEFEAYAREVIKNGGARARQALFNILPTDELAGKYIVDIMTSGVSLEDLSFFLHRLYVDQTDPKDRDVVFNALYNTLVGMDKLNYHFKTDDDITFARDIDKRMAVRPLAELAAISQGDKFTLALDKIYDAIKEDAQALYLEINGDRTKLDKRACIVRFLKVDSYWTNTLYEESKIILTYDEAVTVSDYLKTKRQTVKKRIVEEFLKSKDKERIAEYLCAAPESYKREVGEEMKASFGKVSEQKLNKPPKRYEPNAESIFEVPCPVGEIQGLIKYKAAQKQIKPMSFASFKAFWDRFEKFRNDNADYEYTTGYLNGTASDGKVTLGARFTTLKHEPTPHPVFANYPLGAEFKEIFAALDQNDLAYVLMLAHCLDEDRKKLFTALFDGKDAKAAYELLEKYDRSYFSASMCRVFIELYEPAVYELLSKDTLCDIVMAYTSEKALPQMKEKKEWLYTALPDKFLKALINSGDDPEAIRVLLKAYCIFVENDLYYTVPIALNEKAYENGIVSEELARYFLFKTGDFAGVFDGDHKRNVMRPGYPYKKFRELLLSFMDDAALAEFDRGVLATPNSGMLRRCGRLFGVKYYIRSIVALRGLTWVRSPYGTEKDAVISAMLKISVKAESDDYQTFKNLADEYKLTKDELIRATLFNPEFVDYTAEYLGIKGLKTAVYWFYAHLNETLYGDEAEERAERIKEFSDISYPDFHDGAFDNEWYNEMVASVPEKDLKCIYDNAKYVTVGGLHKRAQRFFDAVGGRITKAECLEKINGTRNKDFCLIYSLIPVKDKADLLERYEILSEFVRSGKSFGAQRQASERRTVDIAFENLARSSGYKDTDVFVFEMEAQNPSDIYKPYCIDDITVTPYIDAKAFKIVYKAEKGGKALSAVPNKYGKNKTLTELKDAIKALNKKFARIRKSFENCMVCGVVFTLEQIRSMCRERIINAVLEKLLLLADGELAVCRDGFLYDISGKLLEPESVTVAHPVTLKNRGLLETAISYVVKNNIVQPFKQVLREIYVKSEQEREQTEVLRFKGFNVDLKKCVAALKGKGWGVSEDIGLRRVFYKSNTIAAIFREFDCFYIADYENENRELHGIFFYDRKSGDMLPLKDVDDVTFSETLRDVDLMITISSNTIYDFELAMSTVEIRAAVLRSIVDMLKLDNVSFLKDNIKVTGHYGTYVINIRTGLVFKEGTGNLLLDTVYSVEKPILLDFVDEDPMTADIISKAIVLANDKNIKDPSILSEIKA